MLPAVWCCPVPLAGAYLPRCLSARGGHQSGTATSLAFHLGNMLSGGGVQQQQQQQHQGLRYRQHVYCNMTITHCACMRHAAVGCCWCWWHQNYCGVCAFLLPPVPLLSASVSSALGCGVCVASSGRSSSSSINTDITTKCTVHTCRRQPEAWVAAY